MTRILPLTRLGRKTRSGLLIFLRIFLWCPGRPHHSTSPSLHSCAPAVSYFFALVFDRCLVLVSINTILTDNPRGFFQSFLSSCQAVPCFRWPQISYTAFQLTYWPVILPYDAVEYGVWEYVWIHPFLTSALAGGECWTSGLGRFIPWEETWYRVGGWKVPRANLDSWIRKPSLTSAGFESRTVQLVA